MNIRGISPNSNVINLNKKQNKVNNIKAAEQKDRIEISSAGRKLMSYGAEAMNVNNEAKIEKIKNDIKKGTYNIDAKLTAQSLVDVMKGRKV